MENKKRTHWVALVVGPTVLYMCICLQRPLSLFVLWLDRLPCRTPSR